MPSRKRLQPALMFLCVLLAACGSYGEPPATTEELTSVHAGKRAAVLIRFDGEDQNGKALRPFATSGAIILRIGDEDTGGAPSTVTIPGFAFATETKAAKYPGRFLSKESRDDGWLVLFLPPGFYYVTLPTTVPSALPPLRVEVPSGVPVIYAGTIYLAAETEAFPMRDVKKINAIKIENESDRATTFAQRGLGSLPAPVTRLMKQHSGPYQFGIPTAAN